MMQRPDSRRAENPQGLPDFVVEDQGSGGRMGSSEKKRGDVATLPTGSASAGTKAWCAGHARDGGGAGVERGGVRGIRRGVRRGGGEEAGDEVRRVVAGTRWVAGGEGRIATGGTPPTLSRSNDGALSTRPWRRLVGVPNPDSGSGAGRLVTRKGLEDRLSEQESEAGSLRGNRSS